MTRVRAAARSLVLCGLAGLGAVVGISTAGAATTRVVSSTHPFSNPIRYPMHAKVYLDCVFTNLGCSGTHTGWTMDFVLETLAGNNPAANDLGVYAMGAGRMHVGQAHGSTCGTAPANFGTWVWIDHGAGVTSLYGHFASIAVADGTLVAAGQRIGKMGTTGKNGACTVPYLDFQVRHRGVTGPRIEVKTLKACYDDNAKATQNWPIDIDAQAHWRLQAPLFERPSEPTYYSVWNDVPKRSVDFPATTVTCIPNTPPATPNRPSGVTITRSGSGRLTLHWTTAPAGTTHVQVRLSQYHPSTNSWDRPSTERYAAVSVTSAAYTFTGLTNGRLYRAIVEFENSAGWSRPSAWVEKTPAS